MTLRRARLCGVVGKTREVTFTREISHLSTVAKGRKADSVSTGQMFPLRASKSMGKNNSSYNSC